MGTQKTRGFTIIETMLFLAISGLLVVTMLAGVGITIQVQRYRDSVESFKTLLQDQYSELASVKNDERTTGWSCDATGATVEGSGAIKPRGQSKCVMLGRYMKVVGPKATIYTVVGYPSATQSTVGNDIAKLRANYTLNISTVVKEESLLEWGATIQWAQKGPVKDVGAQDSVRSIGLLFIRSPDSGQIYTFTSNSVPGTPSPTSLKAMLVAAAAVPGQAERTLCVESGGAVSGGAFSIYIYPYANGPTSIESRSNDFMATQPDPKTGDKPKCYVTL